MRSIRLFLYGIPVALLLLFAASFINASYLSVAKKNEMSIGTLGEPSTLNPIQQADSASSEVAGLMFNGLLKYSPNLDIIGDLATSWKLTQETVFRFKDAGEAARAGDFLQRIIADHTSGQVTKIQTKAENLILTLARAGYRDSEEILSALRDGQFSPIPISPASGEKKAEPFLAEPIIHFSLRRDVRWHDGVPFTSADVSFTYRAIIDERVASPIRSDFDFVASVDTPDPYSVIVRYKKPFSPALSSWMGAILPSHLLDGVDPSKWADFYNRHPVGTGPFKFGDWKTNEFIRLVKNKDYFRGSPWLDSVVFRVLPDPLTLQLAFQTRQVDFWNVEPWAVKELEHDSRYDLFSSPSSAYNYIGWNLKRQLFSDLRVRQALAEAVNIPQMIKYIIYGRGVQSTGIFTPRMWFFDPNVQPIPYDPQAAKMKLDEAGWKPGPDGIRVKDGKRFAFTIITNNGNDVRRDIATLVQDDLKKIGIEVRIEIYEWAVMLKNFVNKGEFDAIVLGWGLGNDFDQYQIWHSTQTHPEELNFIHYSNPKVDRLLSDLRQEYSHPEIIKLAAELQQTIYDDQPYLFLFVPEATSVMWKDSYRIRRPGQKPGEWIDSPVIMTKAGWQYDLEWFYRPEYPPTGKDNR